MKPDSFAHDPDLCATCSGERQDDPHMRPLRKVADYLEDVVKTMRKAGRKTS